MLSTRGAGHFRLLARADDVDQERFEWVPLKGKIEFRYDGANDLVIATPRWVIETEADVALWHDQYVSYMQRYDRKMDMVIVLDHFEIKAAIGVAWGLGRRFTSSSRASTTGCMQAIASNYS